MSISTELDLLLKTIESIPAEKRYWLVRTQSGTLYETFRENGVVALDHSEISLSQLNIFTNSFHNEPNVLLAAIRAYVRSKHEELLGADSTEEINLRRSGLIASQIYKFAFEIKKGDTVIIPSYNSDIVSFGTVTENHIGNFGSDELRKIGLDAVLKRRVKWVRDIKRIDLDPYLYRMFTAHQALNDVGSYADVIERSLKDFFVLDEEAHLIINIQTEDEVPASDLFGLGSAFLKLVDEFSEKYSLGISSKDLHVTITLNSPGKIDLKSRIRKVTLVAGLILAGFGGGYETSDGRSLKTDGLPGLIKAVDQFLNNQQERDMKREIFEKYKDSLQVKQPEDMIKLLKQFSENKDVAK